MSSTENTTSNKVELDKGIKQIHEYLTSKGSGEQVSVMSFNIRYDNEADGENKWDNRKEGVLKLIQLHKPDMIGFQEVLASQYEYLSSHLNALGYESVTLGREFNVLKQKYEGENCSLFFKTSKFQLIKYETFWLSETPTKSGSKGWDSACTRIVTWSLLKFTQNPKKRIIFCNTHWDHSGEKARLKSADLIKQFLNQQGKQFISENYPNGEPQDPSAALRHVYIVITGDFNCDIKSRAMKRLVLSKQDIDTFKLRHARSICVQCNLFGPEFSFPNFDDSAKESIDHIVVSTNIKVVEHHTLDDKLENGRKLSDHYPILAKITLLD